MFADFVFDHSPYWLRRARLCDRSTDWEVPDCNEIIVIEMPKVGNENTPLANWIRFIKSLYDDELMQLATKNPNLHQAFQILNELSHNEEAWEEYERREKFFLDQLSNEHEAYDNGVRDTNERLMRENEIRQNEQALYLLNLGLLPDQVAKGSGLPVEKVELLMKEKTI